ncbi:MAG: hypothetical protein AB7E76_12225 [Deferribacterales bacterium]
MRKTAVVFIISLMIFSCSSKEAQSPDFLYGSKVYANFVDYYLKGKPILAQAAFNKAEYQFLSMDAMCNLSRIYIGRFVLEEGGEDQTALEKANNYASLGSCQNEIEAVKYLSGVNYDKKLLPEPYSEIAGADGEKLINLSDNKELPDYTRTRLLRNAAIGYIMSDAPLAEELAERALVIDRFNGWSLNILRDLTIIKAAAEKQEKDTLDIEKRIGLVKAVLNKK